jgi:tRNA(fMet)-specific endonuclease VapC
LIKNNDKELGGGLLYNGKRFKENMEDLKKILQHEAVDIAQIDDLTSDRYSRIAAQLKRQGTPIPINFKL